MTGDIHTFKFSEPIHEMFAVTAAGENRRRTGTAHTIQVSLAHTSLTGWLAARWLLAGCLVPQQRASFQKTYQFVLQTLLISLVCKYLAGHVAHGAVTDGPRYPASYTR